MAVQVIVEFVDDELMDPETFEVYVKSFVALAQLHPCYRDYKIKRTKKA